MSKKKEPFRKVDKSLIDEPEWLPRKSGNSEDIENIKLLRDNINNTGLINPVTVKEKGDGSGRFDLIAGSRRLKASGHGELWAKVEKSDLREFDEMVMCASENENREGLTYLERDDFFYRMYEKGKSENRIKTEGDLAKVLGKNKDTITKYIKAGEERKIKKDDIIINMSKTSALDITRSLSDAPTIRNMLLEMNIDETLICNFLPIVTKNIDNCLKNGVSKDRIVEIINISMENDDKGKSLVKLTTGMTEFEPDIMKYVIEKKISVDMAREINKYPLDVRKVVANSQISIKDAEEISVFKTEEERFQLIKEKLKIENWKKKSQETFDKEWNSNLGIRKQQVQDIENGGETTLRTKFDIELTQKLAAARTADDRYDEEFFRKYRSLQDHLNRTVSYFHPKKVKTVKGKDTVAGIVRYMYELLRLVMIEIGEIKSANGENNGKNNGENNGKNNGENSFNRHFVDVEAKVVTEE